MSARGTRRFISDLLKGRRPRSFRAEEADVGPLRAAITLRGRAPEGATPRAEFVTELHQRLAAELAGEPSDPHPLRHQPLRAVGSTRRRFVQATSLAAAAAAVGAVVDHAIMSRQAPAEPDGTHTAQTLIPATGQWRTVSASTDLTEGSVQSFDLGSVIGFVARTAGELRAVSGVCTHLGCRLTLDAPARRLNCPCHRTSFTLNGELLNHQLPTAPPPLPHLQVREDQGVVQIYAPPGQA